jgi:hypothetical protein
VFDVLQLLSETIIEIANKRTTEFFRQFTDILPDGVILIPSRLREVQTVEQKSTLEDDCTEIDLFVAADDNGVDVVCFDPLHMNSGHRYVRRKFHSFCVSFRFALNNFLIALHV